MAQFPEEPTGRDPAALGRATLLAVYLGVFGYILIVVWQGLLLGLGGLSDPTTAAWQLAGQAAVFLGGVTLAGLYLRWTDQDRSYLDLGWPSGRDWGLGVLAVALLLGVNYGVEFLGLPLATHSVQEFARANPEILPPLVAGSLLFVGPGEELLFRNIIQKGAVDRAGPAVGIVVTSVVFAGVHTLAYAGAPLSSFLGTLGVIFLLSVILGVLYEATGSLVVAAVAHGAYDAVAFAVTYWQFT